MEIHSVRQLSLCPFRHLLCFIVLWEKKQDTPPVPVNPLDDPKTPLVKVILLSSPYKTSKPMCEGGPLRAMIHIPDMPNYVFQRFSIVILVKKHTGHVAVDPHRFRMVRAIQLLADCKSFSVVFQCLRVFALLRIQPGHVVVGQCLFRMVQAILSLNNCNNFFVVSLSFFVFALCTVRQVYVVVDSKSLNRYSPFT